MIIKFAASLEKRFANIRHTLRILKAAIKNDVDQIISAQEAVQE
jgi:hypothetical protein